MAFTFGVGESTQQMCADTCLAMHHTRRLTVSITPSSCHNL